MKKTWVLTANYAGYEEYTARVVIYTDREITKKMWRALWERYCSLYDEASVRAVDEAYASTDNAPTETYDAISNLEKKYLPKIEELIKQDWGIDVQPCTYIHLGYD